MNIKTAPFSNQIKKEILKALGLNVLDFDFIDQQLRLRLSHKITFITLGSEGIYVNNSHQSEKYSTTPKILLMYVVQGIL